MEVDGAIGRTEAEVIIAGGGIAGVSAAIALGRAGIRATVLERAPRPSEFGAGITLHFSGMLAAERLGVADAIRAAGVELERQLVVSAAGRRLAEVPFGELADRLGLPRPVSISRARLLRVLLRELGEGDILWGAECIGWTQDASAVTVELADGRRPRAQVVVGADGGNSRVRTLLAGGQLRPAGYQYLRALVRDEGDWPPPHELRVAFGRGSRIGTVAVGGGLRAVFGSFPAPPATGDPAAGRKTDFATRFARFASPFPELIEAIDGDSAIARSDVADVDPLERWTSGRVVLTGDAAHLMTPNLARGASESMADGVALAAALKRVDLGHSAAVRAALQRFEAERREPTADLQRDSRRVGKRIKARAPGSDAVFALVTRLGAKRRMTTAIEREFALARA